MAKKLKRDDAREERITMKIVVDAYDEQERAMGWYYYLDIALDRPFLCRCVEERQVSPLEKGDEVEVVGMADEEECMHEVFVLVRWGKKKKGLAVPLAQLEVVRGSEETRQAVEDWRYWAAMGYEY